MTPSLLLALLPAAAYLCLFVFLYNHNPLADLRQIALRSAILFTIYLVFLEEVLGTFHAITRPWLVTGWLLPIAVFGAYLVAQRSKGHSLRLPHLGRPTGWSEWLPFALVIFVLSVTFVVAWLSPPQTWDSLSYHMSRVAHWAQNHSLGHYITGIERQNSMNPGAEMVTLNFYVLAGGDRLATFTQWFAMLGSLLGVTLIAKYLGAGRYGQWLAACFAATLPMGIVQASSTITDYVAAFWVVCAIAESLNYHHSQQNPSLVYLALAAGMAALAKATVLPFLAPFAVWVIILLFRFNRPGVTVAWGTAALLLALAVNGMYFARNLRTYGAIYNPEDSSKHLNDRRTLPGTLSILLRSIGQEAGFPRLQEWNDWLDVNIIRVHVKLGLDLNDPLTTNEGFFKVRVPTLQEDHTTNPFHGLLILLVLPLSIWSHTRTGRLGAVYGLTLVAGYILFCYLFKWNIFGVRYRIIFFVLMMPLAGVLLGRFERFKPGLVLAYALLITSLPWLFQIISRPLIPPPEQEVYGSILVEPRESLYFANTGFTWDEGGTILHQAAAAIQEQGCSDVGLMLHGEKPEYLFWVVMGAPSEALRMEWNVVGTPSDQYAPTDFSPCAYICQGCLEAGQTVREFNFYGQYGEYELFMNPTKP